MKNLEAYTPPQIYSVKVMTTKTHIPVYTIKVAQASPEKALAFVNEQLGLKGSDNYYLFVAPKPTRVYMPKGG